MAGLTIEVSGLLDFDNASLDFEEAAAYLEEGSSSQDELLQKVALFILSEVDQQFETGGAHQIAGGFAPLHPIYEEWKESNYSGQPILTLTGEYRESWQANNESGGGYIIFSSLEDTKHSWHEFGMPNKSGVLPERPVLMLTDESLAQIDEIFLSHFDSTVMATLGGT